MDTKEFHKKHKSYTNHLDEWNFFLAAYQGISALVEYGILPQHPRESEQNHKHRLENAISFGYSSSIVDLLTHYLFRKPPERSIDDLKNDPLFQLFLRDCDLSGLDYDNALLDAAKRASIFGQCGILVDMPNVATATMAEMISSKIYPYIVLYSPSDILDWEYEIDGKTNRPFLSLLKLSDGTDQIRVFYRDRWEVWKLVDSAPVLQSSGNNPLGEIPFVWLLNERSGERNIGLSDIRTVAPIEASIIRNLSQIEEIVDLAAFPMLMLPMQPRGQPATVDVGPRAVLDFDPNKGESGKPDWLDSAVKEPVEAILAVIERKANEIYRATNTGGMKATESSVTAKSGVALRVEFERLNSRLAAKAANLEEAEISILKYWMKWRGVDFEISVNRGRDFGIEDLGADQDAALKAKVLIASKTFSREISMQYAKRHLPKASPEIIAAIEQDLIIEPQFELNQEQDGQN